MKIWVMAYDYDDYWAILAIWTRSWSKATHVIAVCDGIEESMNNVNIYCCCYSIATILVVLWIVFNYLSL